MSDDRNQQFLAAANTFLDALNVRYMEADLDDQLALQEERDRAIHAYSQARLAILQRSILCKPDDLVKMTQLRDQISQASDIQQLIGTAINFAGFLASRFL